ncbi:MAG: glutamyl-tRNA reductase, partial [Bryobacteraceae bacterium]|nr:glutamyl-tRNA reductase [Bryobacteraceae bacterium]
IDKLEQRLKAREVAPLIVSLQTQLERVRAAEVERLRGKLGALTPQQEEALESLTRGIINKVAHGAIAELRRSPEESIDLVKRVFRLPEEK